MKRQVFSSFPLWEVLVILLEHLVLSYVIVLVLIRTSRRRELL